MVELEKMSESDQQVRIKDVSLKARRISSDEVAKALGAEIPVLQEPVMLTEEAANAAIACMKEEGLDNHSLRIGVTGGGCSGLQYLLDFVEDGKELELDFKYEQCGVMVVVDPFSAAHLKDTVIQYHDTLMGTGFKFVNPNLTRQCGCGSSWQ